MQRQLQALMDNNIKKKKLCPDFSAVEAAQLLLGLSASNVSGEVHPKPDVRSELKLNGLIKPLPQSLNKVEMLSVNGGCGDTSGDSSVDDDSSEDVTRSGCTGNDDEEHMELSDGLCSLKGAAPTSVDPENCDKVPPDPPDWNGYSPISSTSSPSERQTEMEEEKKEAGRWVADGEIKQEETGAESMDMQASAKQSSRENMFCK